MPRVHIVSLGGTIAMTGSGGHPGVVPRLDAHDLVAAVPGLSDVAQVSAESFLRVPGAHLRIEEILDLARHLTSLEADGVVVTQGTDTIEETAFVLDLVADLPVPVVVTGAMRNPELPGADGPANLLAAVTVAADPGARGVLVVFDEQIHAARYVEKTHTSRPDAFRSPSAGPLGEVTEGEVRWLWPAPPRVVVSDVATPIPRVPMLDTWLGDDGAVLEAVLSTRPDGLVVRAMGAGHVPLALVEPLTSAAEQIPVALTSRTGSGRPYRHTYGFPGSETDLLSRGLLWGGGLAPHKLRLLLTLGLAAGWDRQRLSAAISALG